MWICQIKYTNCLQKIYLWKIVKNIKCWNWCKFHAELCWLPWGGPSDLSPLYSQLLLLLIKQRISIKIHLGGPTCYVAPIAVYPTHENPQPKQQQLVGCWISLLGFVTSLFALKIQPIVAELLVPGAATSGAAVCCPTSPFSQHRTTVDTQQPRIEGSLVEIRKW